MCIYTTRIPNKRFIPTKKNYWNPPACTDERLRYIEVECGHCRECLKKKGREWRIRNYEQLKETPTAVYFTGTFTDERIEKISKKYNIDINDVNEIATKEVRLFLERMRKVNNGKSIKHWIVTEKGHTRTRRIHVHGLFYAENRHTRQSLAWLLKNNWIAGYCYNGKYVNERTVNYISKYLTKLDEDNRDFVGKVLCSKGLGASYVERNKKRFEWKGEETKTYYHAKNGANIAMPRYYKIKAFTEDQRELLWIYRENSGEKYVNGFKVIVKTEEDLKYYLKLKEEQRFKIEGMYGDNYEEIQRKKLERLFKIAPKTRRRIIEDEKKEKIKEIKMQHKFEKDLEEYQEIQRDNYFWGITGGMT